MAISLILHGSVFAFLSFLFLISKCSSENAPIVTLPFGKILGIHANGHYEFHNIPFAEPPIGKHRFEPPIPYQQIWDEEFDATKPMIKCVSFERDTELVGTEDCLYLHVLTPDINCEKMYPVRIQIHGGAYVMGSPDTVETSILLERGMVIVTMGYRLGPLGFLSTGDKVIAGNNGLKDQRLAIMWVKKNIKNFCGDENNILLGGASAGGAASHMHLLHKPTENYINAVASHNAAATCIWSLEPDPKYVSKAYADVLHCPTDSSEAMKVCLQGKTVNELKEGTFALQYYKNNPFTVFAPVVESSDSENPFITQHPEEIMRNGQTANVTWLVGYTEREGSYNSASFLALNENGVAEIEILNERWDDLAPILLFFNRSMNGEERLQHSKLLKDTYLGGNKFSEENYHLLENMYTDVLFTDEIKKSIFLHRKYCPGKVYVYYYRYPHEFSVGNLLSQRNDITFGADHTADTIFIIPKTALKQSVFTDRDIKFSEKLIDMYINWANTGVLKFGEKELPLNTPTDDAVMTFNENCYSVDGCIDDSKAGCSCYSYD
ncbi:esterase 6-like [Episyrphus balteatus]|uniref:esterase 6-like n=1 Tax=Episyrphus balteatus TaxID=286459 RepID=UPI0024867E1E|nr:esterase 6-like [Episyrphus balteatus]